MCHMMLIDLRNLFDTSLANKLYSLHYISKLYLVTDKLLLSSFFSVLLTTVSLCTCAYPLLWSPLISRHCVDYLPAAPLQPEFSRQMWRTLQGTCQLCQCKSMQSDEAASHQTYCSALGGPGQPVS